MNEIISKMLTASNREDYFGKIWMIHIVVVLLLAIFSFFGGIVSIIAGYSFMLMWISSTSCQLFTLHGRKKTNFIWSICPLSKDMVIKDLFCTVILQNILFIPVLVLYLLILLNATPTVAFLTGIVHFFFAITIGAAFSVLFPFKYTGLTVTILFFSFYLFNSLRWPNAELYRVLSPVVQLYNMHMIDVSNIIGLVAFTILAYIVVWIRIPLSVRKINVIQIGAFACALVLVLSIIGYEEYRNQKIFNSDYKTMEEDNITIYYRGLDEAYAKGYGKMLTDLNEELYEMGVISNRLTKLSIQKYNAPRYLTARRIPFTIEGDTMFINIFSNAMLNTEDPSLMFDMLNRMVTQLILKEDSKLLNSRVVCQTINEVVQNDDFYSDRLKSYVQIATKRISNVYNSTDIK